MRIVTFWLSVIMIFIIPWENIIILRGIGTISQAMGFLLAGFWILSIAITGLPRKFQRFHLAVFLFMLWQMSSYVWSIDEFRTMDRIKTNFQLVIMITIFWDLYTTSARLNAGLQAYVLGAYVSIGSIVTNYVSGIMKGYLRYTATGFGSNDLALLLALGIPVAWHLAIFKENDKQNRMMKLVNFAYVPAAVFSILLTSSRGGLFAMLMSFFFILRSITRLSAFQRILIMAALTGSMFLMQSYVPQTSFVRL
ncbi:hypothetical protein ACFL6W_07670 [Thermodesulfobacteriota bacterium]